MPTPGYIRDPFQEIRRELDDVFERFLGEGFFSPSPERAGGAPISPTVDISMEGDTLRVEMDLPGVDPDDVDCTLTEGELTIKGERRQPTAEGEPGRLQERRFGRFERRIPMPDDIDQDSLAARFDRGVLTITARLKPGAGQPRRIHIAGAGARATGAGEPQAQAPHGQPESSQVMQGQAAQQAQPIGTEAQRTTGSEPQQNGNQGRQS